jgi:hypothetical protein
MASRRSEIGSVAAVSEALFAFLTLFAQSFAFASHSGFLFGSAAKGHALPMGTIHMGSLLLE